MVKTFINSLKITTSYQTNRTINSFKKFAKIGNGSSNDLFLNKGLKIVFTIFNTLKFLVVQLGSKLILMLLVFYVLRTLAADSIITLKNNTFFHTFLFLSICECFARFKFTRGW